MKDTTVEKICIIIIILGLLTLTFAYTILRLEKNNTPITINNCTYVYYNDTKQWASVGCKEECGCQTIAEYNIEVSTDKVGEAINNVIKNISNGNETWQK